MTVEEFIDSIATTEYRFFSISQNQIDIYEDREQKNSLFNFKVINNDKHIHTAFEALGTISIWVCDINGLKFYSVYFNYESVKLYPIDKSIKYMENDVRLEVFLGKR